HPVTLVSAVDLRHFAVQADHFSAVARRVEVQLPRLEGGGSFRLEQISEHDAWALELVGQVEDLRNEVEAVADVGRRGDEAGIIALPSAEHLPQVALLGLRGNAGRRSGAL